MNYTEYYEKCARQLGQTDYLQARGISPETARQFNLGYDADAKRLVIPVSAGTYNARDTTGKAEAKYLKPKGAKTEIFNARAIREQAGPVFVVEGELDAISIYEAGGQAVGLGSTSNIRLFTDLLKEHAPAQPLILALDEDGAGKTATGKLESALEALGIDYYTTTGLYAKYKDANEALTADREALARRIQENIALAQKSKAEQQEAERESYIQQNSAGSHIQEFLNGISESANTPPTPTGFTQLDSVLDGGLYEGLYILGAMSSTGKTTIVLQMADQIAKTGKDVLIISLEMARTELMARSISRETAIEVYRNGGDIRNAKTARGITAGHRYKNYSATEQALIGTAIENYSEYADHIFIYEGIGDMSVDRVKQLAERHRTLTGEAPVIVVDYLQMIAPHDIKATDKQNMDYTVLELKRLSRDYKTPIIVISSLNRASYGGQVSMEAYKESGAIEYSADVLLGLQLKGTGTKDFKEAEAKKKTPREMELTVLKNRNGKTGDKIDFVYDAMFNYFEEA